MKLVAIGTLVMLGLFVVGDAVPTAEVVGEAAAVQCDVLDLGDVYVDPCSAICYVGQKLKFECLM